MNPCEPVLMLDGEACRASRAAAAVAPTPNPNPNPDPYSNPNPNTNPNSNPNPNSDPGRLRSEERGRGLSHGPPSRLRSTRRADVPRPRRPPAPRGRRLRRAMAQPPTRGRWWVLCCRRWTRLARGPRLLRADRLPLSVVGRRTVAVRAELRRRARLPASANPIPNPNPNPNSNPASQRRFRI